MITVIEYESPYHLRIFAIVRAQVRYISLRLYRDNRIYENMMRHPSFTEMLHHLHILRESKEYLSGDWHRNILSLSRRGIVMCSLREHVPTKNQANQPLF